MKNTDSRILVTGGAGFIGSALVWELNRRGCENIVVCDRLSTDEKWKNLVPLKFADYIDGNDLIQAVQHTPAKIGRFDLVLHLGACSATTERDADYLMRNNYEFTKQLCQWSLASAKCHLGGRPLLFDHAQCLCVANTVATDFHREIIAALFAFEPESP